MILVVIIAAFMTLLSVTLIDVVRAESDRGAHANWSAASFQAAEAGLDDYSAKLVDDHGFYLHYVAPGRVDAVADRPASRRRTAPTASSPTLQRQDDARRRVDLRHDVDATRTARTTGASCRTATTTTCRSTRPARRATRRRRCASSAPGARSMSSTDGHARDRDVRPAVESDRLLPLLRRRREHRRDDVREDLLERQRRPHGHRLRRHLRGRLDHRHPDDDRTAPRSTPTATSRRARSRTTRSTSPSSSSRSTTSSAPRSRAAST